MLSAGALQLGGDEVAVLLGDRVRRKRADSLGTVAAGAVVAAFLGGGESSSPRSMWTWSKSATASF